MPRNSESRFIRLSLPQKQRRAASGGSPFPLRVAGGGRVVEGSPDRRYPAEHGRALRDREGAARYPWQTKFAPWAPAAKLNEAERRAGEARHMFERETTDREEGTGNPLLFYDAHKDLFRFSDGSFHEYGL